MNVARIRHGLFGGSSEQIRSIAILPLENNSGDADQEYLAAGMHEALITDLARIGVLKVIAKPSADAFKGTKKPLRDIGRELGVEALVIGSVRRAGDRIQISAQLVRAATGEILWANRYERNAGDVLSLQNEIVGAIAREVQATITPEQRARLATARPINPAAHDAYLKGRSPYATFINSGLDRKQAYGGLGDVARAVEWYQKGAEERSPNMVYMKVGGQWDPARADPGFQALLRQMNFPG